MGKLVNRISGSLLLISSFPGLALRMHVESLGKALPGKLDIKRHSPSILYVSCIYTQADFQINTRYFAIQVCHI